MSLIGMRQAKYDCASVPPVKRQKKDIAGYGSIVDVFSEALMKKMCHDYSDSCYTVADKKKYPHIQQGIDGTRAMFVDCIEQTISFLKHIHALKPMRPIKSIKLWKEGVQMKPFFEGVNCELDSALVKHHNPRAYAAINKGAMWDSFNLTMVKEAVLYVMEYFTKEDLFNTVKKVVDTAEVKVWVDDHNAYITKNKDRLERESKARELYHKTEMKRMDTLLERMKTKSLKKADTISPKAAGGEREILLGCLLR